MATLTTEEIRSLDPYAFLAVLGKRVIHPGGRASTTRLLAWADVQPGERVLDVGCGVCTTAIRLARECGADVVAADVAPLMRDRALANVSAAKLDARVSVEAADILSLPYPDDLRRGRRRGGHHVRRPKTRRLRAGQGLPGPVDVCSRPSSSGSNRRRQVRGSSSQ